ncbi:MAG: RP/EB family microtubule-associated protein [Bacillariaceae sp.]|jgi:RP/EB family microtubule-associated protein
MIIIDNLEFCQWMKAFYDQSGAHREGYDGIAIRAKGKGGKKYDSVVIKGVSSSKPVSRGTRPTTTTRPATTRPNTTTSTTIPAKPRVSTRRPQQQQRPAPLKASENKARPVNRSTNVEVEKLKKLNTEMESRISELETTVGDIEKERDFYFGKLRSIELFLQVKQDKEFEGDEMADVVENIFKVLYATVDNDYQVDDEGNIVPTSAEAEVSYNKGDISADLSDALGSDGVSNEHEQIDDSFSNEILAAEQDVSIGQ